jgi:hypothetical protein
MNSFTKLALCLTATAIGSAFASHVITKRAIDKKPDIITNEEYQITLQPGQEHSSVLHTSLSIKAAQLLSTARIARFNDEGVITERASSASVVYLTPVVTSALKRISNQYHECIYAGKTHEEAVEKVNSLKFAGITDLVVS